MKKVIVVSILITLFSCGEKNTNGNEGVLPGNSIKKEYLETESGEQHKSKSEKNIGALNNAKDSIQKKDSINKK